MNPFILWAGSLLNIVIGVLMVKMGGKGEVVGLHFASAGIVLLWCGSASFIHNRRQA